MIKEFTFKIKVDTDNGDKEINKLITSLIGFDKRINK